MTPEQLAQLFHETYERLAPDFGYETRKESAVTWSEVHRENRQLMIAVATEILARLNPPGYLELIPRAYEIFNASGLILTRKVASAVLKWLDDAETYLK